METPHPSRGDSARPAGPVRNIYGRRPGRGVRPYLIVLKILSVGAFFGGLLAVLVGVLLQAAPVDAAGWRAQMELIHRVYAGVIIPGLIGALVFGTLLFASIWQAMIRMRWFVTKMILIALFAPGLHVYMRSRSLAMQSLLVQPHPDLQQAITIRDEMAAGTIVALLFAAATIILGRVKPRLGQDYGRTFAKRSRQES